MCTVYSTRGSLLALQRPVIILGKRWGGGGWVCDKKGQGWGEGDGDGEGIVLVAERRDKAREGEGLQQSPHKKRVPGPQQLHASADGLARSFLSSLMGSGNSLYNSTSVSCLRALRAMVWKACSTLMASFALVSK